MRPYWYRVPYHDQDLPLDICTECRFLKNVARACVAKEILQFKLPEGGEEGILQPWSLSDSSSYPWGRVLWEGEWLTKSWHLLDRFRIFAFLGKTSHDATMRNFQL